MEKTTGKFERLRSGGPTFVHGESVEPLQNNLHLIFSKNFPYEFLCATLGQITNSATTRLTQSSPFDLLCC